jgi:hypothetical protein
VNEKCVFLKEISFFGVHNSEWVVKKEISSLKNYIFGKKLNRPFIYKPIHVEKKTILPPPLALRQFASTNLEKVFERVYEYWS